MSKNIFVVGCGSAGCDLAKYLFKNRQSIKKAVFVDKNLSSCHIKKADKQIEIINFPYAKSALQHCLQAEQLLILVHLSNLSGSLYARWLFLSGCLNGINTHIIYGWSLRGSTKNIAITKNQKKVFDQLIKLYGIPQQTEDAIVLRELINEYKRSNPYMATRPLRRCATPPL